MKIRDFKDNSISKDTMYPFQISNFISHYVRDTVEGYMLYTGANVTNTGVKVFVLDEDVDWTVDDTNLVYSVVIPFKGTFSIASIPGDDVKAITECIYAMQSIGYDVEMVA